MLRNLLLLALAAGAAAHASEEKQIDYALYPNYDPTVCHPLDKTDELPAQCLGPTWSLDPPCPKCWANPSPDYTPGAPTDVGEELRELMKAKLDQYLDMMFKARPGNARDSGRVFEGIGGRALLLLKLYDASQNATYLDLAAPYVKSMEARIGVQKMQDAVRNMVGFQWSHVGMLCVSALAADLRGDAAAAASRIAEVQKVVERAKTMTNGFDDFDAGRAGLLYAARFLEANIAPRGTPKIPVEDLHVIAKAIIARGVRTGRANGNDYMQWHGPNDAGLWLGHSHGSAGVLTQLLAFPEFVKNDADATLQIRKTLDHTLSKQFPSGNFPGEYYNETQDVLVQWDHGAPGVMPAFVQAYKVFGDEKYLAAARKALDCTWNRGLLLKGLMNCHGIGGNTWMQIYAAQELGDDRYAYRALMFADTVVRTPLLSEPGIMRVPQPLPNTPWDFWVGSYESAIELWTDLVYRGIKGASETGFMPKL